MSEFAHVRARDFNLLTDNDTSPSPDTFERLMSAVCPEELRRCLSDRGDYFAAPGAQKPLRRHGLCSYESRDRLRYLHACP